MTSLIQFFYNKWYLMALDITETKLIKQPKEIIKNSFPKYKFSYLTFKSTTFDFINLPKILN